MNETFKAVAGAMRVVEGTGQAGVEKKKMCVQLLMDSEFKIPPAVSEVAIECLLWAINNKREISMFLKKRCCCCG